MNATFHSFSIFSDNVTAEAAIMRYYQGNKVNPRCNAAHYNSHEAKIVAGNLAEAMRVREGGRVTSPL